MCMCAPNALFKRRIAGFLELLRRALDLDDLELKDEHRAGRDELTALRLAIGKLRGNVELPLVALLHHLHGLGPPFDDLK